MPGAATRKKKPARKPETWDVELWPLARLTPYARNAKPHSEAAIQKLATVIRKVGVLVPIVVDADGVILKGHRTRLAAMALGLPTVPVRIAKHLSEADAKAWRIADNRLGQDTVWDDELLRLDLGELEAGGFDLALTGFGDDELRALLRPTNGGGGEEPEGPPDPPVNPVTVLGDLITLGRHRLLCGDSTNPQHVDRLMGGRTMHMAYNDPPYGVEIVQGGWVGGGEANNIPFGGVPKGETELQKRARLGAANGSKPFGSQKDRRGTVGAANVVEVNRYAPVIGDDSTDTARDAYRLCAGLGIPVLIFWGGNYYADALPASSCWLIWDKQNTGNFADAELAWTNQTTAVRIFRHMWNGMVRASERGRRVHPTQKPVVLAEWCFEHYGKPGDNVLDLFGGSGSALIACERTGRTAYVMELSPAYCDVIITRWEQATGQTAQRPQAAA